MKCLVISILFLTLNIVSGQAIPSDVKKIVGFIYEEVNDTLYNPLGTGFFVSLEKNDNLKTTAIYFVTAKHVLKNEKLFRDQIYLRLNKKDSSSQYIPLKLSYTGSNKNVFLHQDKDVDIAVIPVIPNPEKLDFLVFPSASLTNKQKIKELKISEGTDIFFTGLFTSYMGENKIYPIFRFGRVALMSEERIPWNEDESLNLYLFESTTYGGNSGSPVFFYLGSDRGDGGLHVGAPQLWLAGVMKGYFGGNKPLNIIETKKIPVYNQNFGIAAIVPSYYLEEIIFSDELIKLRGF